MTVLAATAWNSNADMIEDCARLGYLLGTDRILDPTFGKGNWWKKWRPVELVATDARPMPEKYPEGVLYASGVDFCHQPWEPGCFDAAVYDPPYVCVGGRKTTGIPEFHDRFGLTDAPRTPAKLQELINDGLTETARMVKPRGHLLVKCADYISGGKLWIGTHYTLAHALSLGLTCFDRWEMVAVRRRPQPPMRNGRPFVQQHAGRNLSTLFVFRTPR